MVQNNNPIRVAERIKYTESIVSFFFLNIRRYLCQLHNMSAILLSPGMGLLTYIKHAYVTCRLLTAIYISHLVFTLFLAQFLCTSRVYISFASFGGRNVCTHFVTLFCYELNLHTRISIFFCSCRNYIFVSFSRDVRTVHILLQYFFHEREIYALMSTIFMSKHISSYMYK